MFKAGDKIVPDCDPCPRHWKLMEIVKYDAAAKTATVKDLDGDIIENFNLNPDTGVVPFKVAEQ